MALFNDVSAIVQASRPRQMGPNTGGQSMIIKNENEGYGPIGESMGNSAKKMYDYNFDPEVVGKQAEQTYSLMSKMPDELKAQIYANPDFQDKAKKYYRLRPEMFADAGFVTGNEALRGKLAFVGDETISAATGRVKSETDKNKSLTAGSDLENEINTATKQAKIAAQNFEPIKAEALINEALQKTKSLAQKSQEEAVTAPIHDKYLGAETKRANAQAEAATAGVETKEKRLQNIEDMQTLRNQRFLFDQQKQEEVVRKAMEHATGENEKRVWAVYNEPMKVLNKQWEMFGSKARKADYVSDYLGLTRAHLADAMGSKDVKTADGRTASIPLAITNGPMVATIHKNFDMAYDAAREAKKDDLPADLIKISQKVDELWKSTFAPVQGIKFNVADQEIVNKYNSRMTPAKAFYVMMMGDWARAKIEKKLGDTEWLDKERMWIAAIKEAGGLPTEITPPEWWGGFLDQYGKVSGNIGAGAGTDILSSGLGD